MSHLLIQNDLYNLMYSFEKLMEYYKKIAIELPLKGLTKEIYYDFGKMLSYYEDINIFLNLSSLTKCNLNISLDYIIYKSEQVYNDIVAHILIVELYNKQ